ncbi:MAG: beta-galactosidase trimerization domain-containing protein [Labilithrix sp.]|nr:beta-galactosidase trimerization domain-containing protein [Labilithrix sp.]
MKRNPRTNTRGALGRRDLLRGIGALGGLALWPGCNAGGGEIDDGVCNLRESADVLLPRGDWQKAARVAGIEAFAGTTVCDLGEDLDRMAGERVSVVEVSAELSTYAGDDGFAEQLRVIDLVARECHARGMRCLVRWPLLEVVSADGARTVSAEHPDWLQIGMDGGANVVLDGGDETAWMCPTSGWADALMRRIPRLTATAIDGLWGDATLLGDAAASWTCVSPSCATRFRAETGLELPTAVDWDDPRFIRWVTWRHRLIAELEQRIAERAKASRADFEVLFHTTTMDHGASTRLGLDAAFQSVDVGRAWTIDPLSDASAMREAGAGDWYALATMMKHARATLGARPSWVVCYGKEEDDAERVMALAIATGSSPCEARVPDIETSVGSAYRRRMYAWLESHPEVIASDSASDVAVLYSSASRDVLDRGRGLYASTKDDSSWWSRDAEDSVLETEYLADFRGFCALLMQRHVPFDVLPAPRASDLDRYRAIIVPSAVALEADLIARLRAYVERGGAVLVTGADAGTRDEVGALRSAPLLMRALELASAGPPWAERKIGDGRVVHAVDRVGRTHLRSGDDAIARAVAAFTGSPIETDAPPSVIVERRAAPNKHVVACANLTGIEAAFTCTIDLPRRASRVTLTSPGAPDAIAPFSMEGSRVRFVLSVRALAAAVIDVG